nr:peptidoglycan recognition family protein [Actinokineospora iranica]
MALTAPATPVAAAPADRQSQFRAAAAEFGVPEPVLLAVSYLESRWDANGGRPSTAAGYGPMHLTDVVAANAGGSHHDEGSEDPRGDDSRETLTPEPGEGDFDSPALRTIELAADLTGTDASVLRSDPAANIRGGAALLAHYQRPFGSSADPGAWYGAVARYSGATAAGAASAFADEVFSVLRQGVERVTDDGHRVRLAPAPSARPDTAAVTRLGLRGPVAGPTECPATVACDWIPAPYQQLPDNDYGNHDKANRPSSAKIDYIVIHDTEATWDTTLRLVQDPTYVSWHYSLRSADGLIAQHVPVKDVGWHAGNWYVNAKSIGLEHEGFAAQGSWYTEAMYRTSAKLVRHLAAKHRIPLDRAHIIGHDNVPGTTPATVRGMHWDPGPYWDWGHYFDLLGAPLRAEVGPWSPLVMVKPDYASNRPAFFGCDTANPSALCPARGSTSVILRAAPSDDAPLLVDVGLRPDGSPATMHISDHGSRVDTGQRFAVAERRGAWTAVWYLGQKGWLRSRDVVPVRGTLLTPVSRTIPVYGRAYPEAAVYPAHIPVQNVVPLQYTLSARQWYSVGLDTSSEYYWAASFDPANHAVVRGEKYYEIQFGHRVAFVKADDVRLVRWG